MKVQNIDKIKALLKAESKRAFNLGLVWGKSGNMSMRKDAKSFFITASGKSLGDITVRDLVLCGMDKDNPNKASMEWRLHSEIYHNRKDANAVFHSQPAYSTLIACVKDKKINTSLIPESIAYLKKIEVLSYSHAGSIELAKKCGKAAKKADVLLLENHGVVAFGSSIEDAVNITLTLEFLCRLIVLSKTAGMDLRLIPPRQVKEFLKLLGEGKRA
ncbi:MAG: class II aldolase/adducin family protein [Nitrospira sp.]|nr:class II aldolase/adducin family protein [Nitrospira sp.]